MRLALCLLPIEVAVLGSSDECIELRVGEDQGSSVWALGVADRYPAFLEVAYLDAVRAAP